MYTKNNKGSNILLWGTPEDTGSRVEWIPLMETNWLLELRYSWNQHQSLPEIPKAFNLPRRSWCGTLSNAFWKSRYTVSSWHFFSMASMTPQRKVRSCCRHEWSCRTPNWAVVIDLPINSNTSSYIILSSTLEITQSRETSVEFETMVLYISLAGCFVWAQ